MVFISFLLLSVAFCNWSHTLDPQKLEPLAEGVEELRNALRVSEAVGSMPSEALVVARQRLQVLSGEAITGSEVDGDFLGGAEEGLQRHMLIDLSVIP